MNENVSLAQKVTNQSENGQSFSFSYLLNNAFFVPILVFIVSLCRFFSLLLCSEV